VFFDTALDLSPSSAPARPPDAPGLFSIVAAAPSQMLTGRSEADWEALRELVAARQVPKVPGCGIPPGFAAGWVEYDGTFCFGIYDHLLAFRHGAAGGWHSLGPLHKSLRNPVPCGSLPGEPEANPPVCFKSVLRREEFTGMVERAQAYIAAGDIYQVNLSHRFTAPWPRGADSFAFYRRLRCCSPAPHAAFLQLNERSVLSSSPELFLKISGRTISTRPIKGTRPRRAGRRAGEQSAQELVTSPKERAELVMITDLERNDLGHVCEFGSVTVSELLKLERFEQVFHLVSTVDGRLRPELDAVSALRACFPGGSITGAPKKRAMEIIAELERTPRGLYTGAIGYFGFNGESQFNIAIRTLVIENGQAHFHAGAGIVADSEPEKEWQETLDKAAGILLTAQSQTLHP
jgi:aminodeoxychorismate synthase component I